MSGFRSPESRRAAPRSARPPPGTGTSSERLVYERILPAVPASIGRIRRGFDETLSGLGVDGTLRTDIALAVTEAVTNAVLHAYLDARPGPLYVAAGLSGRRLRVSISDCGRGMVPRNDSPGLGVGLSLIRRLSDELTIVPSGTGAGTCVSMVFSAIATVGRLPAAAVAPGRDDDLVREYLHLLSAAGALQENSRALIAEAEQAVAKARRLRSARRRWD
jgi:serine/threonine-protein kinase RsbW/stage II sporulation protein AB (anti-sigma F factor)